MTSAHDVDRPLSAAGRLQAEALAGALCNAGIRRFLSSPARRCRETVEPLVNASRGASLHMEPRLLEGAPHSDLLDLATELDDAPVLFCSHGDLIPALLEYFQNLGLSLRTPLRCEPGSVWRIEGAEGTRRARYIPAPDVMLR